MNTNHRIMLIGGGGFIGHHLALALKQQGNEILIVDNLYHNNYHSLKKDINIVPTAELYLKIINQRLDLLKQHDIQLEEMDARDYHGLCGQFLSFKPDIIIQLAAIAHAGRSNKDPYTTFDNSLRTLENALDASRSCKIEHFIYFSSSMVYGNFQSDSVTEETPCSPMGIYGALKYAGEKMVIAYNQVFDLPYTIIRPSALYGERCVSRRVGQIFIENALQDLDVLVEGDGFDRLDFTYIQDLVSGVIKIIENKNAKNEIFNLTFGQSRSINDLIRILQDFYPNMRVKFLPKDKLLPSRGTLSIEKARQLLNYESQYPLERGVYDYIKWYKSIW